MRGIAILPGIFLVLSLALSTANCASGPVARPTSTPAPVSEAKSQAIEVWQQKWDRLLVAARKEGQVVIGSSAGASVREALTRAFTGKYGVNLEFISGKPAELVPKVQAERRNGLYLLDVFMAGMGTVVPILGSEGALEPLDGALVLPEVLDKTNWWGGDLMWTSPAHLQVMILAFPQTPVAINTSLVGPDEIKSYHDLLNPKWKEKIVFVDPSMAGNGNIFFSFAGETMGLDYLRQLGNLEPLFTRDQRLPAEWLSRGKYPVAIGIMPELITEFRKAGAPIKIVTPREGTYLGGAGGGIAFMSRAPHPNAAKLFINWVLTREGGTAVSQVYGGQSARLDVPADFLEPDMVRQPGVKYVSIISEEGEIKKREYMKLAREIYGNLLK